MKLSIIKKHLFLLCFIWCWLTIAYKVNSAQISSLIVPRTTKLNVTLVNYNESIQLIANFNRVELFDCPVAPLILPFIQQYILASKRLHCGMWEMPDHWIPQRNYTF